MHRHLLRISISGMCERYEISVAANGPRGSLVDRCAEIGVPFHDVPHLARNVRNPRQDASAVRELRGLVSRVEPDLVQINSSKAGTLARIALIDHQAPVVYTAHGWAFSGRGALHGAAFVAVERLLTPLTDAIVCVSKRDRALALSRRVAPESKLWVIHNGVEVKSHASDRGAWPEHPLAVCVARLAPPKDIRILIDALAQPELHAWRLRVVGDGPDRAMIERHCRRLGVQGRVEILGERRDVSEHLEQADAFVLPSDWEGLPYSVWRRWRPRFPSSPRELEVCRNSSFRASLVTSSRDETSPTLSRRSGRRTRTATRRAISGTPDTPVSGTSSVLNR